MGQAFGGVTGILFLVLLLVSFYIALRLMFAVYAYVEDFSIGVMGAVRKSWTMTQGNMWTILLCILMIIVLNLLGLVVTEGLKNIRNRRNVSRHQPLSQCAANIEKIPKKRQSVIPPRLLFPRPL